MESKKYFKFDEENQYLENESDIKYFISNQARRVAVGNMLGDFDENGLYVLKKDLVKQLVNIPKIIVDNFNGVDLIRSAVKFDNYLHFMLVVEEDKASLLLLEKINFESNIKYNVGSYSNMNEYVLEEIKIPDKDIDKNIIYSKFNIKREDEGIYYDINNFTTAEQEQFSEIINKMKQNYLAQNEMLKNELAIEKIEADYFDEVLSSFQTREEINAKFEKILKSLILEKKSFIEINKPFFQKTINEILDNCLLMILPKLSPAIRAEIEEEIRKAKEKYYNEYNKIIHLMFLAEQNMQQSAVDSIIGSTIAKHTTPETSTTLIKIEVDEKLLENDFNTILNDNKSLRSSLLKDNSDAKDITDDNSNLKKFFDEIKEESKVDMLKTEEETAEVEKKEDVKIETSKDVEKSDNAKGLITGEIATAIKKVISNNDTKHLNNNVAKESETAEHDYSSESSGDYESVDIENNKSKDDGSTYDFGGF